MFTDGECIGRLLEDFRAFFAWVPFFRIGSLLRNGLSDFRSWLFGFRYGQTARLLVSTLASQDTSQLVGGTLFPD